MGSEELTESSSAGSPCRLISQASRNSALAKCFCVGHVNIARFGNVEPSRGRDRLPEDVFWMCPDGAVAGIDQTTP